MSSYGMSAVNCTNTTYPPLQSNPDIDGIGMLIGFVATSYLTFICCATKAYLDFQRKPPPERDNAGHPEKKNTKYLDRWSFALETAIVSFSDQQVITGISVFIGGVSQLEWGLDLYHWQTVANLDWFSAFTHIITLTVLREDCSWKTLSRERIQDKDFKAKKIRNEKIIRNCRVFAMLILLIMLVIALYPVGYITTNTSVPANLPAWCLYHPNLPWYFSNNVGYNWLYITFTFGILFLSWSTRVLLLFVHHLSDIIPFRKKKTKSIRSKLDELRNKSSTYKNKVLRSIYTVLSAGKRMFTSTPCELFLALVWGTARIFATRQTGGGANVGSLRSILSEEDTWAFGQVVAMALLVLPFISFLEAYFDPPEADLLRLDPQPKLQEDLISTTNSNSQGTPGADSPSALPVYNPTSVPSFKKEKTAAEKWDENLFVLWYLLSVAIGADLIYVIPATNGTDYLTSSSVSLSIIIYYIFWILLDMALLWFPTLVFMDENIQRLWMESLLGKWITGKSMWCLRWGVTLILVLISIFFDAWTDVVGINWIDNLEYI